MTEKSKKVGDWEKHTKGIGFKLLNKFGYSGEGGLGAKGHGISRAVEVVVRPTNLGLGFGEQLEASALKVNKKIEAEWRGIEYKDEDGYIPEVEKLADAKTWKKGTKGKVAKKSGGLSSAELMSQYMSSISKDVNENGETASITIIDMRHAEARVLTDLADINGQSKIESYLEEQRKKSPKLGQELLYNINLIAEQHDTELAKLSRKLNAESKKRATLEADRLQYMTQSSEQQKQLDRLERLATMLMRLNISRKTISASDNEEDEIADSSAINIESITRLIEELYDSFPEEFNIFGLMNLLPDLLSRSSDLNVSVHEQWSPLHSPRRLLHMYESWEPLTRFFERRGERVLASQTVSTFQSTIEKIHLPLVRRAISNDWKVFQEAEACVALMETISVIFPPGIFEQTVDMLILPRISSAVTQWQPFHDLPCHIWLHPWLPSLRSKLSAVYPELRRKMGVALGQWKPATVDGDANLSSQFAFNMLLPWRGIFDSTSFDSLVLRNIVPKLMTTLRDVLVISPSGQDITPFQCVMVWKDLLPAMHLSCLFAGEFFPKWLRTLSLWLSSPTADFSEVSEWYSGWKSMFNGTPLETDETVLGYFNLALEMMQAVLAYDPDEEAVEGGPLAQFAGVLSTISKNTYVKLVEQKKYQVRMQEQHRSNASHSGRFETTSLSFREVVEAFAERNNVEFTPRHGKFYQGKQLWLFGRVVCYMDNNVMFAMSMATAGERKRSLAAGEEEKSWTPVDLEELLRMTQ